jgi:glycine cleavage system H protein
MDIPTNLRYSKDHEWVHVEDDIGTIGITDYAQDQLGDLVYLDLPAAGAALTQSEKMGEIESVKAVSDLFSPVTGEVTEVNQESVDAPELVNEEPYGSGWLMKVRLSDASELDGLLTPEAYEELLAAEEEEPA